MNTYTNPYRTYSNEADLDAYINLCGQASELLAGLYEYVDNHGDVAPDNVGNADVDRMRRIVLALQTAASLAASV